MRTYKTLLLLFLVICSEPVHSEQSLDVPKPIQLQKDWWDFFDVSIEIYPERVNLLKSDLEKIQSTLTQKEHQSIHHLIERIGLKLDVLRKKREAKIAFPAPQLQLLESYSLKDLLEINTRIQRVQASLKQQSGKAKAQQIDLTNIQSKLDQLIISYRDLEESSLEKLQTGLEIIANRIEFAIHKGEQSNLKDYAKHLEQEKKMLNSELTAAEQKLTFAGVDENELEEKVNQTNNEFETARLKAHETEKQVFYQERKDTDNEIICCLLEYKLLSDTIKKENLEVLLLIKQLTLRLFEISNRSKDVSTSDIQSMLSLSEKQLSAIRSHLQQWEDQIELDHAKISKILTKLEKEEGANHTATENLIADIHLELDQSFVQLEDLRIKIKNAELLQRLIESSLVQEKGISETWWIIIASNVKKLYQSFQEKTSFTLFRINENPVTLLTFIKTLLIMIGAVWLSRIIRNIISTKKYFKTKFTQATEYIVLRTVHYLILLIGFIIALSFLGFDFTNVAIVAGALGVGIGFGLQNIANNILSGFLLLFQRKIKVGDIVQLVDNTIGKVKAINLQNTHVRSLDGADLLVPNSLFSSQQLINWTMKDWYRRFHIQFDVAYGTDKDRMRDLVVDAVKQLPCTVKDHSHIDDPQVWMVDFGDYSLIFKMVVWIDLNVRMPHGTGVSAVMWEIDNVLNENGISIPFPQRDLYVKELPKNR